MKIILSRKGLDSGNSDSPSPIVDDTMVFLPIPINHRTRENVRYQDIQTPLGLTAKDVIDQLNIKLSVEGNVAEKGHLDPDLDEKSIPRKKGWRPVFGQAGGPQTHLENYQVGIGDLFLFFGWFRFAEQDAKNNTLKFIKGKQNSSQNSPGGFHAVFGYLEVGEIYPVRNQDEFSKLPDWLKESHPHTHLPIDDRTYTDHVYVAADRLSLNPKLPGAGMLRYSDKLRLTKQGESRSKWDLDPRIFKGKSISHHSDKSWKDGYFQSVGRGQEFVIEADEAIMGWVRELISGSTI